MEISILIPTLANEKSLPYLKKCIQMIRKNSEYHHQILVMVNGENFIKINEPGIRVFYRRQQGQCGAVNALAKEVTTKWMMITDDDSMFPPKWERILDQAEEWQEEHHDKRRPTHNVICMNSMESGKIGAAPPFVVKDCGQDLETFRQEEFEAAAVAHGEDVTENGFSYPFLIKKELWDKLGGYDEHYDPWGSNCDSDFHYKLMLAGVQPVRDRRILNYHFSQISGTFEPEQNSYWLRNKTYFENKWGFRRADSPTIWYQVEIPYDQLKYKPLWAKVPGGIVK